jgi:beta-N-acetylhexosaminidase
VATDQEGGSVRHVKGDTSDTPGNLAIGSGGYPQDAYYTGYYIGLELRALGINMNFAPTIDIYSTIESTVIGPRSFGESPEYTGILGAAWAKGHADAGVIATAKHFPGHGDTDVDSHGALPSIDIDEETLFSRELVPFMSLIESGVPAIMTGHISFPKIVPNGEPASLSKDFVTGILRNKLGYEGLVITDDIMMQGAWQYAGVVSNVVRLAIEAGNDIVISSSTAGPCTWAI